MSKRMYQDLEFDDRRRWARFPQRDCVCWPQPKPPQPRFCVQWADLQGLAMARRRSHKPSKDSQNHCVSLLTAIETAQNCPRLIGPLLATAKEWLQMCQAKRCLRFQERVAFENATLVAAGRIEIEDVEEARVWNRWVVLVDVSIVTVHETVPLSCCCSWMYFFVSRGCVSSDRPRLVIATFQRREPACHKKMSFVYGRKFADSDVLC